MGHLHYIDNLCELERDYKMPQRFGKILDFVITPRQQHCPVGKQVETMARIGVEVALIQEYPTDLITPQSNTEIYNQDLGETLKIYSKEDNGELLTVLLVSFESTININYTQNQFISLTNQLSETVVVNVIASDFLDFSDDGWQHLFSQVLLPQSKNLNFDFLINTYDCFGLCFQKL